MDAIIGRYKVRLEETGLVLRHPTGISFELTVDETLGLGNFIRVYQQTLTSMLRETDPALERIVLPKQEQDEEEE
jgi:hypothetical protein